MYAQYAYYKIENKVVSVELLDSNKIIIEIVF
jgi:hypothetical protein